MGQHVQTQKKTLIGYVMAALFAVGAAVAGSMMQLWLALPLGLIAVFLLIASISLRNLQYNITGKDMTSNLAFTGLLAAVVLAGFFLSIKFPLMGTKAQVGFGNVFCVLAGLILGPVYGGFAAGIGGFFYDLLTGWADSSLVTFALKFLMAFITGLITWGVHGDHKPTLKRIIPAAIVGSLAQCLLYLGHGWLEAILLGNPEDAIKYIMGVKVAVTLVNAAIADVVAIPLFEAIRSALKRSHLAFNR